MGRTNQSGGFPMFSQLRPSVTACMALTLLTALGAGPATQPTAPRPLVTRLSVSDNVVEAARIITPRKYADAMPNAPIYMTPRSEWIPKLFNGERFYIIPCESGDSRAVAAATVAPSAVKVECATPTPTAPKISWDRLLTAPSTQPAP